VFCNAINASRRPTLAAGVLQGLKTSGDMKRCIHT
jgi:hypothetical protein